MRSRLPWVAWNVDRIIHDRRRTEPLTGLLSNVTHSTSCRRAGDKAKDRAYNTALLGGFAVRLHDKFVLFGESDQRIYVWR